SPGESSTLTWSSANATVCTGYGFSTDGATSGSISVSPITTTAYGLSCANPIRVGSTTATLSVSQTNVVNATDFAGGHGGTCGVDPYPLTAIVSAINSLPAGGGTVIVADGCWTTSSVLTVSRGNFNLVGASLNAKIVLAGSGPEIPASFNIASDF